MSPTHPTFKCPKCKSILRFPDPAYLQRRERELQQREDEQRQREQHLRVRELEHEADVRLIKNCLHPDKHPEQADRYTRAWQAFERLLASATKPEADPFSDTAFNDDIPF